MAWSQLSNNAGVCTSIIAKHPPYYEKVLAANHASAFYYKRLGS
jgi:hypothetical protein